MRILIVDDEFVALTKMTSVLENYGDCICATNGLQAFEMYSEAIMEGQPFELIVMDINMPGMNGLSLLERIYMDEQYTKRPSSQKIIVTAANHPNLLLTATNYNCSAFLVKPVKRDNLKAKLQELGVEPVPRPEAADDPLRATAQGDIL